eukprot:TRINITY_DN7338_c0_g1_i4.p1 TRINITY_DN7338_c0_g1~~TRINITY_DN7338_c0_g1_i4.p1  ORF type:complete len:365 (+),score=46.75 TRINITY_DN7338_c0_g1_i4:246-1340(+)
MSLKQFILLVLFSCASLLACSFNPRNLFDTETLHPIDKSSSRFDWQAKQRMHFEDLATMETKIIFEDEQDDEQPRSKEEAKESLKTRGQGGKRPPPRKQGFFTQFTHFLSLPLHSTGFRQKFVELQNDVKQKYGEQKCQIFDFSDANRIHITLGMLNLTNEDKKAKTAAVLQDNKDKILEFLQENGGLDITFNGISTFESKGRKVVAPRVLFVKMEANLIVDQISNLLIRDLLAKEVLYAEDLPKHNIVYDDRSRIFKVSEYHLTFARVRKPKNPEDLAKLADPLVLLQDYAKVTFGSWRVKTVDVSTRFLYDTDQYYLPLSRIHISNSSIDIEEPDKKIQKATDKINAVRMIQSVLFVSRLFY